MSGDGTLPDGLVVAIDGPSGSGKSSVSREVALRAGLAYLDTGAMYRAAAWWCLDQGIALTDTASVTDAVIGMDLRMGCDPRSPTVAVGPVDVGSAIRDPAISAQVSFVAVNLGVRAELRARQRAAIAAETRPGGVSHGRGIVAEGRDITTVVAPDAHVRVLLTASEAARLARRSLEVHGEAGAEAIAATRDQVLRRDADDSTVVEFHTAADGVVTIDSTALTFAETVEAVLATVRRCVAS